MNGLSVRLFGLVCSLLPLAASAQVPTVRVDGSSTVYPLTEAVAEEFQKTTNGKVHVTVGISGSGGGFKKFLREEIDIGDASRPILNQELAEARKNGIKFLELPIAFDALSVVVNKENNWADTLTTDELKRIWEPQAQGKVTNWNQVRPTFPDVPLKLFGPGADSGTFDYFTEVIVGKSKASRGDYLASEDDNVLVQGVSREKGALGYFGYAYYTENKDKLKVVAIDNGQGGVMPSEETLLSGKYVPLSRPLFIYVNTKALSRPEVEQFVEFYLRNVGKLAREIGYLPLPDDVYEKCLDRLKKRATGTSFAGHAQAGLSVHDLFKGELHE